MSEAANVPEENTLEARGSRAGGASTAAPERGGLGAHVAGKPRGLLATALLYVKGLAVGVSDLVPGFSGGTMALVVGIYPEVIAAISSFSDRRFLGALRRGRLREAFRLGHGAFILTLGAGMLTAIVLLAPLAGYLLTNYPLQVAAFFFGLVLASAVVAGGLVRRWGRLEYILLPIGAVGAYVLVGLAPTETPDGALFLMLAGAIAVCALVLPGFSGSFMLVLLSKYDVALAAVTARDFTVIVPLMVGGVIGILSFARVMSLLLKRYHDPMLALLTGFVVGSLRKVWPYVEADGITGTWPWLATGPNGWGLLMLMVAGVLAVLALERAGKRAARSQHI